jgi:hypothetical protein
LQQFVFDCLQIRLLARRGGDELQHFFRGLMKEKEYKVVILFEFDKSLRFWFPVSDRNLSYYLSYQSRLELNYNNHGYLHCAD